MAEEGFQRRLQELNKVIMTMEWDLKRNQLFDGKRAMLDKLKTEFQELSAKQTALMVASPAAE